MSESNRAPLHLTLLVVPHFNLSATTSFLDPFRVANYLHGEGLFRWDVISEQGGEVQASNGMAISTMSMGEVAN
ncbi:MAG: GlxA family transcriptional regulator, partial [Pseudomonadota bacterium]